VYFRAGRLTPHSFALNIFARIKCKLQNYFFLFYERFRTAAGQQNSAILKPEISKDAGDTGCLHPLKLVPKMPHEKHSQDL